MYSPVAKTLTLTLSRLPGSHSVGADVAGQGRPREHSRGVQDRRENNHRQGIIRCRGQRNARLARHPGGRNLDRRLVLYSGIGLATCDGNTR